VFGSSRGLECHGSASSVPSLARPTRECSVAVGVLCGAVHGSGASCDVGWRVRLGVGKGVVGGEQGVGSAL